MRQYLDLAQKIVRDGFRVPTRAVLKSTGQNVHALSLFGPQVEYDLRDGFPAVTTKRLAFGLVAKELLWFLRGEDHIDWLRAQGAGHIWQDWTFEDGRSVGPAYGVQWRKWLSPNGGETVDQVKNVVRGIREAVADRTASVSRRLIVSAWNPADVPRVKLPPCHSFFQFNVQAPFLDLKMHQRSADYFIGVPFNIASYALLLHMVAQVTGLRPRYFVHSFGDVHVYENHVDQVREQIGRAPRALPTLLIDTAVRDIDGFEPSSFELKDYDPWPALKGEVAV